MTSGTHIADPVREGLAATGQTLAQLGFELGNAAAGAPTTIYITTDPTVNKLELQITTDTDGIVLTHGTPVSEDQAGTVSNSLLYLDLSALNLSADEWTTLAPSATGWTFAKYPDDGVLCMTPEDTDVTIHTSSPIALEIDALTIASPPSGSTVGLSVTTYNVANVAVGQFGRMVNFKSALQAAPDGGADLHQVISVAVKPSGVVCSTADHPGVANSLKLILSPGPSPRAVPANAETSFTLTFVYADPVKDPNGYGALTDTASAMKFGFARGPGADSWGVTDPQDNQDPAWLLMPEDGQPIVGTDGTVEFDITNIVTTFQPGPTVLLLTYADIKGYANGVYTILLEKYAHAEVSAFDVSPQTSVLVGGEADVTLTWTASGTSLAIGYAPVTGLPSYQTQIERTTTFTLTATGEQPGGTPNQATMDVTADVLPVVNSFVAEPLALDATDFSRQVQLSWNVNTNDNVELVSSVGPVDKTQYQPADQVLKTLERPEMVTLVPVGDPDDVLVRRSLIVSAFNPAAPVVAPTQTDTTFVAIAPTTGFIVTTSPSQNTVSAFDTLVYQPAGQVTVGSAPGGLCFSPDGSVLYAVTSGDGKVSVIRPSLGSPPQTYGMAVVASVDVGGAPQQVATSPDGLYVYVTIDAGSDAGTLAVLKAGANGALAAFATLPVGVGPRGVATTASGAHVYVANSGDGTLTIVGVGAGGHHSVVGSISKAGSKPVGVAVTRPGVGEDDNGGILLVSSPPDGTVVAIDTQHYDTAQRQTLTVDPGPQQITLVPGGAYAAVANSSGTLSVLGLGATPGSCSVLHKSVAAAAGATGIAASPDAGLLAVACPGAKSLALVMLDQYAEQDQPVSAGTQPTNVAVAPDGSQAVAWHNALVPIHRAPASPGVYVYDVASSTVAQQLGNLPVVAFAYDVDPTTLRGYLLTSNSRIVQPVDPTSQWNPASGAVDLTPKTQGQPLRLALSVDGTTMFVLAIDSQLNADVVAVSIAPGTKALSIAGSVRAFTTKIATITALACAPDGSKAYALDSVDAKIFVIARQQDGTYAAAGQIAIGQQAAAMAISPDGSRLFVLGKPGQNNTLTTIPLGNGGAPQTVVLPDIGYTVLQSLAVSPDGTKLFATDGVMAGIRVFDAASLRLIQTISWTTGVMLPSGIAVAPDGSQIYTANTNSNNLGVVQQVQPA